MHCISYGAQTCAGICCGKTEFCCLKKDGLGYQRKLRGRMTGAGAWPERKAKFAWSVAGGGCRGTGSTQDPPFLPAAASHISWGYVCILYSAEHSTHCALMCATEWSGYLKAECSKGSPLTAGLLSSLALSVKGRPDAGWEACWGEAGW